MVLWLCVARRARLRTGTPTALFFYFPVGLFDLKTELLARSLAHALRLLEGAMLRWRLYTTVETGVL